MGKVIVINNADFSAVAVKKVTFEKGSYISINASIDGANSLISGNGFYAIGETATISATTNDFYRFIKWSDGNTNATRTITITDEETISLIAEYESLMLPNDFIWGNGGISLIGNSSGSLNITASSITKLVHTLSECVFSINGQYYEDFRIQASGIMDTRKPNRGSYAEGEYVTYTQVEPYKKQLTVPAGKYVQIAISNTKDVAFTSDLSACAEILLVKGEYELD